jgi:hypothetical protein
MVLEIIVERKAAVATVMAVEAHEVVESTITEEGLAMGTTSLPPMQATLCLIMTVVIAAMQRPITVPGKFSLLGHILAVFSFCCVAR